MVPLCAYCILNKSARCTFALEFVSVLQGQRVVTFHDDLRLALSDERSRRLQHGGDTRRGRQRHGSGDSSRCGGTVHVPVNSEVNRHPPGGGGGRSKGPYLNDVRTEGEGGGLVKT